LLCIHIFSYILQGSVQTHLWCGGTYNNHLLQIVRRVCQWKCHVFYWLTL